METLLSTDEQVFLPADVIKMVLKTVSAASSDSKWKDAQLYTTMSLLLATELGCFVGSDVL